MGVIIIEYDLIIVGMLIVIGVGIVMFSCSKILLILKKINKSIYLSGFFLILCSFGVLFFNYKFML